MDDNLIQIMGTSGSKMQDKRKVYIITPKPDAGFFNNELNLPEGSNLIPNASALLFASRLKKERANVEFSDYFNNQNEVLDGITKDGTKQVCLFLGYANYDNGLKIKEDLESKGIKVVLYGVYNFVDGQNFSDCSIFKERGIEYEEPVLDAEVKMDYGLNKSLDDLFEAQKQFGKPKSLVLISQYSGCPKNKNCLHCSSSKIKRADGSTVKMIKSPEDTIAEMIELKNKFGLDVVVLGDLMVTKQRLKELSEVSHELELPNVRISTAPNHITEESVNYLKKINCREVFMGVESFNNELIKSLQKSFSLSDVERAMTLLYESGIRANVSIMLGIDGENKETLENTLNFVKYWKEKKIGNEPFLKLQTSIMTPIPGSRLYEIFKERNGNDETIELLKRKDWIRALQERYAELFIGEEIASEIDNYFKELRIISESSYVEKIDPEINEEFNPEAKIPFI